MLFPVLEDGTDGQPAWARWAGKTLHDPRNAGRTAVLDRSAAALAETTVAVTLGRGQLLVVDQQLPAHGRTALGPSTVLRPGLGAGFVQAKAAFAPAAPPTRSWPT
ncbi:hypothetical protein ACFC34_37535 [Streptomyces sp. NPDC056053]|uniref:hypothetical protein n=1 Tax=Streptomyces sp. NPDC056053 TaxID=3345696 RepID=UPI0035D90933